MDGIRFSYIAGLGLAAATLLIAAPAAAQLSADQVTCEKSTGDIAIAACTRAIASGLKKGLKGRELAWSYTNRGVEHRIKGDADRAIVDHSEAIRLDPKFAQALVNRGNAYSDKKDYHRAIVDFSAAIRFDPKYWNALRNRGAAYFLTEQYDRAIADFDAATRTNPKAADGLYGRGLAKLKKADTAGGNADIAAAKQVEANITEQWMRNYGIAPPAAAPAPTRVSTPAAAADCSRADLHWKSAEEIKLLAAYEDHLARFGTCDFATLAKARIEALKK